MAQQAVTSSEGGKRLRALLTLDAFRAFAPQDVAERDMDAVLDLACAIEVFQTGALVHDDIIDDSDLRRGKPSAHRAFSTGTHSEAIGHGLGIMLGDMLATASVDIADKAASKLCAVSPVSMTMTCIRSDKGNSPSRSDRDSILADSKCRNSASG